MKKFVTGILFILISTLSFGQTISGSFAELASCGKATFVINFDDASIHGMSVADFECIETDWSKDLPEIKGYFIEHIMERLYGKLVVGYHVQSDCSINVQVLSISTKGDFICDVTIKDGDREVALIHGLYGNGGGFGTKLHLIKKGAKHTGNQLGTILFKELEKVNKQK